MRCITGGGEIPGNTEGSVAAWKGDRRSELPWLRVVGKGDLRHAL